MDRLLNDLFGLDDLRQAADVTSKAPETDAGEDDPEREARREARRRSKADRERQRKREEFVQRYTAGDPAVGFTTAEAVAHLREMRDEMSPAEFRNAMRQTLEHLPPSQRDDFAKIMREYQGEQPADAAGSTAASPATGASTAGGDRFGGLLAGLMGGAGPQGSAAGVGLGDLLDDLQKSGWRAPDATPGEPPTEDDFLALLNSPLGRAVLGGVAAYGIQGMQGDDDGTDAAGRSRQG
jgi:hypothetical protein